MTSEVRTGNELEEIRQSNNILASSGLPGQTHTRKRLRHFSDIVGADSGDLSDNVINLSEDLSNLEASVEHCNAFAKKSEKPEASNESSKNTAHDLDPTLKEQKTEKQSEVDQIESLQDLETKDIGSLAGNRNESRVNTKEVVDGNELKVDVKRDSDSPKPECSQEIVSGKLTDFKIPKKKKVERVDPAKNPFAHWAKDFDAALAGSKQPPPGSLAGKEQTVSNSKDDLDKKSEQRSESKKNDGKANGEKKSERREKDAEKAGKKQTVSNSKDDLDKKSEQRSESKKNDGKANEEKKPDRREKDAEKAGKKQTVSNSKDDLDKKSEQRSKSKKNDDKANEEKKSDRHGYGRSSHNRPDAYVEKLHRSRDSHRPHSRPDAYVEKLHRSRDSPRHRSRKSPETKRDHKKDSEKPKEGPRKPCPFYAKGRCIWGRRCRNFHGKRANLGNEAHKEPKAKEPPTKGTAEKQDAKLENKNREEPETKKSRPAEEQDAKLENKNREEPETKKSQSDEKEEKKGIVNYFYIKDAHFSLN